MQAAGHSSGYGEPRAITPVVPDIRLDPAYPTYYANNAAKNMDNGLMLPPPFPDQNTTYFNGPRLPGLLYEPNGGAYCGMSFQRLSTD